MTARLDISHQEDKKGLDVQMSQLTDANGVSVLVSDITAGNVASGTFAGAVSVGTTLAVTGATTLTGALTLAGGLLLDNGTVAAAGSTVADAAALTKTFVVVTAADGTKGVVLPTAPTAGKVMIVQNNAASALKVWPDASATINSIAANGALSVAAHAPAIFIASSATQWWSIPLLPS